MHTINEWLKANPADDYFLVRPSLVTKDGSSLDVQASPVHRSLPRSVRGPWTRVEIRGWPEGDTFFSDDGHVISMSVHVNTVDRWILLHGGIKPQAPNAKNTGMIL